MAKHFLYSAVFISALISCEAFFKPFSRKDIPVVTPKDINELKNFLCEKYHGSKCVDKAERKIIINQVFDFTGSEGNKEEMGCFHRTEPKKCLTIGQKKLNIVNQCNGLTQTKVSYSVAGRCGLTVGSNKVIVGQNGGGLKGKGLRLEDSHNVEIRDLSITDINPHIIWGGDAIDLIRVKNVLIDRCYVKNIGRQMIVTHFGKNTQIKISNTVFDGRTPYSSMCDGTHYWLWLFLGDGDEIALQNNVILNTSGRGPHLLANNNGKTLLHMIQNTFYDINGLGLIDHDDTRSSILAEGNVFYNVSEVVHKNLGQIYMPRNRAEQEACVQYLGRKCVVNTVVLSHKADPSNSIEVLKDFSKVKDDMVKMICMRHHITQFKDLKPEVRNLLVKL